MRHALHVIPSRNDSAAENMARDLLLLDRYPTEQALRFRHYGWARPSYTFGLSQQFEYARSQMADTSAELCRRPTGGGVVDHRNDWTYALMIPHGHPLAKASPTVTYEAVHRCVVVAMREQDSRVSLNQVAPEDRAPSICFNKSELHDVVLVQVPTKIAGAAQKRSKAGFLTQGSIARSALANLDWDRFYTDFIVALGNAAEAVISYEKWPEWDDPKLCATVDKFRSQAWNRRR